MNALVESLLAPAPEVDPEDATNFDDGTAARTSTGFKAGEDLAVIPKRRLVDDGEAPVGLAKSSRAELFDDGLDSGDDEVVPEDDDDIDEAIYGDDDDESDESDEPQATRQMSVFSKTDDGVDDLLDSFDAEDQAGAAKAAEKAPAKTRAARVARQHADLEADVLEFRVLLEGALRAAAKVEPASCDSYTAVVCRAWSSTRTRDYTKRGTATTRPGPARGAPRLLHFELLAPARCGTAARRAAGFASRPTREADYWGGSGQ